jgi:hypothetical protein
MTLIYLTRARIRTPLTARLSPWNDKIFQHHWQCEGQDRQRQGKDSGQGGEKTLVKTHTSKMFSLWPVGSISDQFPTRGTPTTSLRLARQVSASHDKSGPDWRVGPDTRHEHRHRRAWVNESPRHVGTTAGGHAGGPPRQDLNAGLTGCTAITSPSSLTLPHASSAWGTQAPSTTRTGLDLGSGMAS